jgi:hypothetical protein
MKIALILYVCLFLVSCANVQTATTENTQTNLNKTASVTPAIEKEISLKPVTPNVKFNAKQQKYLNESLPPKVRKILEKAEKFEVLAEFRKDGENDGEWTTFEPNRILKVADERNKKEILEAFYFDASREDSPAVCYYPRHLIRAVYEGKTAEVEICFSCSRFIVRSESGEFDGTIVRDNRKSEDLFSRIIESKGIEHKQ